MTVLIVIGVLILMSVLLVNVPVTAHIKFYGGRLEAAVKYLWFGIVIFPRRKKRRKKRKRARLPSPKKKPLDEDEEIFEDFAEIGFSDRPNARSESESGFDEDDFEEGDAENGGNEQENASGKKFAAGGYRAEDPGEKNAEISIKNPDDLKGNLTKIPEDDLESFKGNSMKIPEDVSGNSEENSTGDLEDESGNFKGNLTGDSEEKPEDDSGKSEKKSAGKSNKKSHGGKKSSKKKSSENPDDECDSDEPKKPLGERISELLENFERKKNAALLLWELCEGHIKKLLGKVTVDGLAVDFAAADEDAARAALAYGKLCAGFYNLLGVMMSFMKVKIRSVRIDCLYNTPSEKARYDGEFKVKLRPASLLNAFAAILFDYVRGRKKYKPMLDELIGSGSEAVSASAAAVKRYKAKNSTN